jgi:Domain of unknown function (DUF397)
MTESGRGILDRAIWRKSSFSSPTSNNCVEVATNLPGLVAVRDSKNPHGPSLLLTPTQWRALLTVARSNRLRHIA